MFADYGLLAQSFVAFLGLLALITVYHRVIAKGKAGDWFETHAFANAITVVFALPAMFQWLCDPISVVTLTNATTPPDMLGENWWTPSVLFHSNNHWAILSIIAVHTYHCIAFNLSKQDIFHHFMFVPTIGVYGGYCMAWGPLRNCVAFFISGLPGGIDYITLVLVKRKKVSKLFQKRLASKINIWFRGPGIGVLMPFTCYVAIVMGKLDGTAEIIKVTIIALLCAFNGLHYMEQAVRNYQYHLSSTKYETKIAELNAEHESRFESLRVNAEIDQEDPNYYVKKEGQTRQSIKEPLLEVVRRATAEYATGNDEASKGKTA